MKRFLLLFFVMMTPAAAKADVNVFACEPEWAALASDIGGAAVSVTTATTGKQDPHHIRAKPSLLAAMRKADLVFCTGAGLETGWLPILMEQAAGSSVQPGQPGYLMASDHIALVGKPARVDRAMGDVHPEGNPHIQTDPQTILKVAGVLAERLAQIDAANAAAYRQSLAAFTARWQAAMSAWSKKAAALSDIPVVVYHDNWRYLYRWTGLKEVATLEVKPGVPPTPSHLQDVLSAARGAGVKMILLTPYDDDDAAEWLARETGAKIVRLPFTVGGDDVSNSLDALFARTVSLLNENVR